MMTRRCLYSPAMLLATLFLACSGPNSSSDGELPEKDPTEGDGIGGDGSAESSGGAESEGAGGDPEPMGGAQGSGGEVGGTGAVGAASGGDAGTGGDPSSGGSSTGGVGTGGQGVGGSSSGGASSGGTSAGGTGSGGDGAGGAAGGNTSSGGSGYGGEGSGGASSGGSTSSGGGDPGGSGGGDPGGSGGGDPGGSGGSAPTLVRFDYFHDGAVVGAVSEKGAVSEVFEAPGNAPTRFVFPEAEVAQDGLFSGRRQSLLTLQNGSLYRLEGQAYSDTPPAPVQVTGLSDVTTYCGGGPVSPPGSRDEAHLLLAYTAGSSCSSGLTYTRLPLLGDETTEQLPWDGKTSQVRDSYGTLDGFLRLNAGQLSVVDSYESQTVIKSLLPLTYVAGSYLYSMDDGTYFLMIMKSSGLWNIYHYDTSDHTVTGPLGENFTYFSGPGGHRSQSEDFLFFTAIQGATTQLYRLKKDGSTPLEPLSGLTGTPRVLGVVDAHLYYAVGGSNSQAYRVPVDANFASPPAAELVLGGTNVAIHFLSEDRLFYTRHLNGVDKRIGVVKLDGSEQEEVADVSLQWLGCDNDPALDFPNAVDTGQCIRVHAAGYFYSGQVRSYSSHSGGTGFFSDTSRGPIQRGSLTPEPQSFSQAATHRTHAGALGQDFIAFQTVGTLYGITPPNFNYTSGIFWFPKSASHDSQVVKMWTAGVNVGWLN